MYKWFERYFAFSRRELNGICVLGGLLFVLWLIVGVLTWGVREDTVDMARHIEDIERFLATASERKQSTVKSDLEPSEPTGVAYDVEYFFFDPNGLSVTDWKRLGLSERQIRVIKNYEAKGGRFQKKEDLKKIYSLHDRDYIRLEPYIRIPVTEPTPNLNAVSQNASSTHVEEKSMAADLSARVAIELNATDSLALQRLPGIGPVYASRIVRFRDRLGGFHDVSQLLDVYGMDTMRFNGLKSFVYVDSNHVKKIGINSADYEQLKDHPFINPKLANAIVQYRKQHGPYRSLSDLWQIAIMDDVIFRKIVPYLTLSND